MDAVTLLTQRHSQPRLTAPAPSGHTLDKILTAGSRAPDHASLQPWHFIICEGEGLNKLGNIFQQSAVKNHKPQSDIDRAPKLPLRAPMVIVAVAKYKPHEKVPRVEQICSAACAVVAMQMCALAQGFNGMWRTGPYSQCEHVKSALELEAEDEIVGFLYLGTPVIKTSTAPQKVNTDEFVTYWQ
jgi:nitroreductase